ncbi:MAG: putative quinol monooxygenase [Sulfitobacter sp.]
MYVVCVTFDIKPGQMAAFLPLMRTQAQHSLALERNCHVFDVCRAEDDESTIFLYEVYADQAAFITHLSSSHFITFDAAVSDMVHQKTVTTYYKEAL